MSGSDPFPPSPAGQKRFKIHLESKEHEMMGSPDAMRPRPKFLYMQNPVRYNNKLPIVVYMPENGILKYAMGCVVKRDAEGLNVKAE